MPVIVRRGRTGGGIGAMAAFVSGGDLEPSVPRHLAGRVDAGREDVRAGTAAAVAPHHEGGAAGPVDRRPLLVAWRGRDRETVAVADRAGVAHERAVDVVARDRAVVGPDDEE